MLGLSKLYTSLTARRRMQGAARQVFNIALYSGDAINALRIAGQNNIQLNGDWIHTMVREVTNSDKPPKEKARQYVALMDPFRAHIGVPVPDQFLDAILAFDSSLKAQLCQHSMNGLTRIKFLKELLESKEVSPDDIARGLKNVYVARSTTDTLWLCRGTIEYALVMDDLTTAYNVAMLLPSGDALPESLWKILLQRCISTWGVENSSSKKMIMDLSTISLKTG